MLHGLYIGYVYGCVIGCTGIGLYMICSAVYSYVRFLFKGEG